MVINKIIVFLQYCILKQHISSIFNNNIFIKNGISQINTYSL